RHRKHRQTPLNSYASKTSLFTFSCQSIACERHPHRNEDSMLVHEETGLAAVFDGVGGSAAGEIASQTAARATQRGWQHVLQQQQEGRKVHTLLESHESFNLCTILEQLIQK